MGERLKRFAESISFVNGTELAFDKYCQWNNVSGDAREIHSRIVEQ